MKLPFLLISLILSLSNLAIAEVKDPCLTTEFWNIPKKMGNQNWVKEFHNFTGRRSTSIYGFTQAVQLRRISQVLSNSDFERDFSEYWVARVLFNLKLFPLAHQAFTSVYENSDNLDLKRASYACMARIQMEMPDWKAPDIAGAANLEWTSSDSDVLLIGLLGRDQPLAQKLSPGHKNFVLGVAELKAKKYPDAIVHLKNFIQQLETPPLNSFLARYKNQAHLFLGRAYYSVAKFAEAAEQFQKVKKTSNEQIEALSNLAWAYLLQEKYDDAIGVALQLRSAALKSTFAPEPIMVAAMALNEICIFPESIRMIQAFVKDYEASYDWLTKNVQSNEGYVLTLKALKHTAQVPVKLATEWIRRPEFLTRQTEINTLLSHPKLISDTETVAAIEQNRLTRAFIGKVTALVKEVQIANLKLKPGQTLPPQFADRYMVLRKDLRKLAQFYRASKTWKALSRSYQARIPSLKENLVGKINQDFVKGNKRLLSLLHNVRDNCDLIEVEIYNGASQDLVWKSANPDFEKVAKDLETEKASPDHSATWSWGHIQSADVDNAEIWEDELGALKADVSNQCGVKDKYLKLNLMKQRGAR